jgi:hypothetical protein
MSDVDVPGNVRFCVVVFRNGDDYATETGLLWRTTPEKLKREQASAGRPL